MLWSLCTLLTALTCVSSEDQVTQEPPVLSVRSGETASMDCNLGISDAARWYKLVPGQAPQYLLYMYFERTSPNYGPGISSSKYDCTFQSESDYRLIINNVDDGDSAVYYCSTWTGHGQEYVSQRIRG